MIYHDKLTGRLRRPVSSTEVSQPARLRRAGWLTYFGSKNSRAL
jgi:hypothetical protein